MQNMRTKGNAEAVRFNTGKCSLGTVLVAASPKGICAIFLGENPARLQRELQKSFPEARQARGDARIKRLLAGVKASVEAPGKCRKFPLDARGTAFQRRVWTALRQIPAGSTATYSDIARRIGSAAAVRAVAGACASNNIAVAIPCHRVVCRDGNLSGYRWGVSRKRALLKRELSP